MSDEIAQLDIEIHSKTKKGYWFGLETLNYVLMNAKPKGCTDAHQIQHIV